MIHVQTSTNIGQFGVPVEFGVIDVVHLGEAAITGSSGGNEPSGHRAVFIFGHGGNDVGVGSKALSRTGGNTSDTSDAKITRQLKLEDDYVEDPALWTAG